MKHPLDFESRNLNLLVPKFKNLVENVITDAKKEKITLVPFFTLRGPLTQARFWTRGRSNADIQQMINNMHRLGCKNIASVLQTALNERGKKIPRGEIIVTNALPGQSWHMFGEAVDMYVEGPKKKPIWDSSHKGYEVYTRIAESYGLTSGAKFKRLREPVHVQLRSGPPPQSFFELDKELALRFNFESSSSANS